MRVRLVSAIAIAILVGAAVFLFTRSGSSGDDASEISALCDQARTVGAELSGVQGDQALIDALAELQALAPADLGRDVERIVEARRAVADIGPDAGAALDIDQAMAVADQITTAEGAPRERVNRALANECGIEEQVPAMGH